MKIVSKCRGFHDFLVYLKDDNDNSLECYEINGDDAVSKREQKEVELMEKYGLAKNNYTFIDIQEFWQEEYRDTTPYSAPAEYPLILVFYLCRELMANKQIFVPFAQSVNDNIAARKANIMAFFLPTDGEEKISCINPNQVNPVDMAKINAMVEEIAKQFDIGQDDGKDLFIDVPPDEDIDKNGNYIGNDPRFID